MHFVPELAQEKWATINFSLAIDPFYLGFLASFFFLFKDRS